MASTGLRSTGGEWWRRGARAAVAASLVAGSAVVLTSPAGALTPTVVNLLTVNDFHGRINATTVDFAKTVEKLRQDSLIANGGVDNTLIVGAGDFIGASEFASAVQQDQPTIDVFNALGVDVSAVGNHEFDQGFADLTDRVIAGGTNAQWDYLGANVYDTATGEPALPEYGVYEVNGITVGVVGVVTQETPTLVSPEGVASLTFGEPVEAINRVTDQLTDGDPANGEADVVVATMHEGAPVGTSSGGTLENNVASSAVFAHIVADTSPKVAALIQGHTHQAYAWDAPVPGSPGVTRPVIQTGNYAANVGQIQLTVDADTNTVLGYTVANVPRQTGVVFDPQLGEPASIATVTTITNNALAYAAQIGSTPVAAVSADITTAFSGGTYVNGIYTPGSVVDGVPQGRDNRAEESSLGNLVADSLVSSLADPERGGAQIGIVNPGGLRAELYYAPDGTVTYAEANGVLPFINNLYTTTLTGAQLASVLEEQWQIAIDPVTGVESVPTRSYLQLGLSENVTYTYDPDPDGDGILVGDLDDQGHHIFRIVVDGKEVADGDTFRVGTFSFLTQGGDNFRTLATGTDPRDSGLIDRDAWIEYLCGAPVGTDGCRNPEVVSPSFAKHAVGVSLDTLQITESSVAATVSNLDIKSLGAPANTSLTVAIENQYVIGTVPVENGTASFDLAMPEFYGEGTLLLTAEPSGTVVRIPFFNTADPGLPSRVEASAAPVQYGTAPAVVATVTSAIEPYGPVTVSEGDTVLGTSNVTPKNDGSGTSGTTVLLGATALAPGIHTLTVSFGGDDVFTASSTTLVLTVEKAASLTLAATTSPTVKVNTTKAKIGVLVLANGLVPASGAVSVYDRGVKVGSGTVTNGLGVVTLVPFTSKGLKILTVKYAGSGTVAASTGFAFVNVR